MKKIYLLILMFLAFEMYSNGQTPINYGTFVSSPPLSGGSGGSSYLRDITNDNVGNVFGVGQNQLATPLKGTVIDSVFDNTYNGGWDGYIYKMSADGKNLLWWTYLGSSGNDDIWGVEYSKEGSSDFVYVTGYSDAAITIPTGKLLGGSKKAKNDAFLAKFDANNGKLIWFTWLGSANEDYGFSVKVSPNHVHIAGFASLGIPTTINAYKTTLPNSFAYDGFYARYGLDGTLNYCTYTGAESSFMDPVNAKGAQGVRSIEVINDNDVLLAGATDGTATITEKNALSTGVLPTSFNAAGFVMRLTPLSTATNDVKFSTLIRKANASGTYTFCSDIKYEAGNIYVLGYSDGVPAEIPSTGVFQTSNAGSTDAFVLKLDGTTYKTISGSMYGGSGNDYATSLNICGGEATFFGQTNSPNLQATNYLTTGTIGAGTKVDLNTYKGGGNDLFVTTFKADFSGITFSSYLGGTNDEHGFVGYSLAGGLGGLALFGGNFIVGSSTHSFTDFPTTIGAYKNTTQTGLLLAPDLDFVVSFPKVGGACAVAPLYVNIPDKNFKKYLLNNTAINTDADTNISFTEASAYKGKINVSQASISSLIGIETFVNIDTLYIDSQDSLRSIDLSKNTNLTYLKIANSDSLTTLDLSKNIKLKYVNLSFNRSMSNIDLGINDSLTYFDSWGGNYILSSLNIKNCVNLTYLGLEYDSINGNLDFKSFNKLDTLFIFGNYIASYDLDLGNKLNLKFLGIHIGGGNSLTYLDVSKYTKLEYLGISRSNITTLDVSKNSLLKGLELDDNTQMTSIDVRNTQLPKDSNAVDFSNNPQLRTICIDNSQVSDTAFWKKDATAHYSTTCAKLQQYVNIPDPRFKARLVGDSLINTNGDSEISFTEASAYSGGINASNDSISSLIGIEAFVNIGYLYCYGNQLTSLDVSKNVALKELRCNNNKLSSLDVTKNIALTSLGCDSNQLQNIDVTQNLALSILFCRSNQLTNIDVTKNTALTWLVLESNQITSLDVIKNSALKVLDCSNNKLTSLDLSKNINLSVVACRINQLTSLDISKNSYMEILNCSDNLLKSLNLTKNSKLNRLIANNNQISYLNVAYNPKLILLTVENNPLTSLYLVQNPLLVNFYGQYNPLLSSICASPTQNTSAWVKDSATVINTTCTRANDNKLLADNYSLDKGETDKFLNVLANDNAVSLQTLYIDLMPDSAGIQQELTTNAGVFTVKNQNQLYFSPSDTVGNVTVKYMLIDSAGIITSNTTTIDLAVKSKLKFYSGFSPNGDNVNNHFHITYVRPNSTLKLNVYDMNGFVVYTNDNYDNKWEGLDNDGKKLANGTYYYIVQYQDATANSEVVQYNGFVEIKY